MTKTKSFFLLLTTCLLWACTNQKTDSAKISEDVAPTNAVQHSSEIEWEALNPARGDQSPKAGTIWGDRKGSVATGFLAKFVDGFSSPPHIHNVTYRAVVLEGLVHNDDPEAEKMWMPKGSFWTQPAGEAHITAAKGSECIAYVEIDSGPYLVKPTAEAFDNGERPVNIDISNMVWLGEDQTAWVEGLGAKVAFLWEANKRSGYLLKLAPGLKFRLESEGEEFRAISIVGQLDYEMPLTNEVKSLDPGSYFHSTGTSSHLFTTKEMCLLYLRTNGDFKISSEK